jgi:hypothetical protein
LRGIRRRASNKRLNVAIDRLHFSVDRSTPEDALVDLIIALEAIYGDGEGANTYKIAMRSAAFLFSTLDDRLATRRLVTRAYKERSALVHGGRGEPSASITQLSAEMQRLVRESLYRIAERLLANRYLYTCPGATGSRGGVA